MTTLTEADVFALLTQVRRGLDADGYDLHVEVANVITVRIAARDDACEDCLVGKDVMRGIVVDALRDMDDSVADDQVAILYPGETPNQG